MISKMNKNNQNDIGNGDNSMKRKWIAISNDRYACPNCNSEFTGRNTRTENWPFCPVCTLPLCGFTVLRMGVTTATSAPYEYGKPQ